MRPTPLICGLAAVLLLASSPRALSSETEERLRRLEQALEQMQQRNAELEEKVRRLEGRRAAGPPRSVAGQEGAAAPARATPSHETQAAPATRAPIVAVSSSSPFQLTLGGFLQTQVEVGDVAAFIGRFSHSPAPVITAGPVNDRFLVRRARLTLAGEYAEQLDFKLELEVFSGTNARVAGVAARDVSVTWRALPEFNIKLGQFKAPFGFEQLTSDSRLISIEQSLVTTSLAPDRQIGIQVSGQPLARLWPDHGDLVTYHAGVFNGTGANTSLNDNSEFMYAGRVEVLALRSRILNQDVTLRFGANGLTSRDEGGTRVSPALFVNQDGSLSPLDVFLPAGREAYGADATLRIGPLELTSEYLSQRIYYRGIGRPFPRPTALRPEGYYLQGSYFLAAEKLQLIAKWESFDPDQLAGDDIQSITAGLNYYIRGHDLKLMVNYIHTWSDFRAANPQYGRSEFDQVTLRLQVMF
jgi:phosphate-selective porin